MEEILELVSVPVVVCAEDGQVEWMSTVAVETFGELGPMQTWTLGPSESAEDAFEALTKTVSRAVEVWIGKSSGYARAYQASARPLDSRWIVSLAEPPREQSSPYPVGRAPDIYFRLDRDGRIGFASGPCMGKPPEVITGQIFSELLPPEWGVPMHNLLEMVAETPCEDVTTSRVEVQGKVRSLIQRIVPVVSSGEAEGFILQWWDETESEDAVEALRVREAQYRQAIENSLDLVGIFDAQNSRFSFISPNCVEIVGYKEEDIIGRPIFDFIDPDDVDRTASKLSSLLEMRTSSETIELRIRHASGKNIVLEARARMLENDGGEHLVLVNARDVTERHESQLLRRSLLRADKLAAIGQVAASVAHEVNNPASFITTNLHVMRDDVRTLGGALNRAREIVGRLAPELLETFDQTPDGSTDRLLAEIDAMVNTNIDGMARISHIVRELRSFSRADDDDSLEFIDLSETLSAACNMVRNQISYVAQLDEQITSDLPKVFGDRGKISQVVVNLLVNASQAVQQAPRDREHRVAVSAYVDGASVRVDVRDTGCGVSEEAQTRIFDPFFTTKGEDEGTGLGLWLCREIVEKCGGRLWLEASDEQGSCFSFCLPAQSLVEIPDTPFDEISSSAHEDSPSYRVLLIDDDELVLESYDKILSPHHETVLAHGGEKALHILSRDPKFDVIICDVIMPAVDGVEVFGFITEKCPELACRTFFCTAGVFTDRTRAFVSEVRDRVVHKPISARQLRSLVLNAAKVDQPNPIA